MRDWLLDTHVWLWLMTEPERIPADVVGQLHDPRIRVFLSAASTWEIAIKYRLGKLPLPEPPLVFVSRRLSRDRILPLPVEVQHSLLVADLPDHHRDPFDRLLVAQAREESLRLLSADRKLEPYDVELVLF